MDSTRYRRREGCHRGCGRGRAGQAGAGPGGELRAVLNCVEWGSDAGRCPLSSRSVRVTAPASQRGTGGESPESSALRRLAGALPFHVRER